MKKFKMTLLKVWLISLSFLILGCTPEEKGSKNQVEPHWEEAKSQNASTNVSSSKVSPAPPTPVKTSKAPYRAAPLLPKEPEAVNGVLPFIEATTKLSDLPVIQDLRKQAHGKVQVIEFFNYPCPWCAHIDAPLQAWLRTKPKDVIFMRIPVLFHPNWAVFCKAYYLIESLAKEKGVKNTAPIHAALFEKVAQNFSMGQDLSALYAFFVEQGLVKPNTEPAFIEQLSQTNEQADIFFAYRIKAIPTFVVQGKKGIYSTNINAAGTPENVFKVVDYLTAINR